LSAAKPINDSDEVMGIAALNPSYANWIPRRKKSTQKVSSREMHAKSFTQKVPRAVATTPHAQLFREFLHHQPRYAGHRDPTPILKKQGRIGGTKHLQRPTGVGHDYRVWRSARAFARGFR
jgi:hypothetical protein